MDTKRAASPLGARTSGWLWVAGLALSLGLGAPASAWAQAAPKPKQAAAQKKAAEKPGAVKLRDPFKSMIVRPEDFARQALPPGKRGLMIAQLVVNGIVVTPTDNIAVVTMPGRNRAYFLRTRDELFDGYVARISEDSVVFRERTTDAFGKDYEREVVKQLSGSGAKR